MSSSKSNWTTAENMQLCESWIFVCHDPILGTMLKKDGMWKEIKEHFLSYFPDTTRTDQSLQSHWKALAKDFGHWRHAIIQASKHAPPSGTNIEALHETMQSFYKISAKINKNFVNQACWELVKNCPRFKILPDCSVPMNASPLEDSPCDDSPMNLSDDDSPIRVTRPEGRKSAKAGKKKTYSDSSRFFEQITMQGAMNIEDARAREEVRVAENRRREEQALKLDEDERQRQQLAQELALARAQREEDWKTMAMDTTNMSPATSGWWKQRRREVMRRTLFRDNTDEGGTSNPPSEHTSYSPVEETDWGLDE